ncbi:hypothetical protein SAMN02745166_03759 [Prosthecobacter debontii]|uniref:Prenyltransferase and squalene oxidase repeat-containing protein n=1 Tax=Prosthecobacter debontii TaxID=48467 RepID=A0A1T4YNE5_9BACT|nr:terpene cyclase/mutase family protein [Prosthecobacter debontii]SKB03078.1 hypothetical protein SAMN02745166_03759 [Prosthecobacter debontii]
MSDHPSSPQGDESSPPVPPKITGTQKLGPPPSYGPGHLGYPGAAPTNSLGYPVQNELGYPIQPGIPGYPAAPQASSAEPVNAALPVDEELTVDAVAGEVFHPPALTHFETKRRNPLIEAWRKVGGGSLTLSVIIHVGILLVGGVIVITQQQAEKQVDFLPGGGTQKGALASAEMQHKVQQKKRTSLNKTMPMKKIVSTNANSEITLPDAPPDLLDVPDVSSALGSGSLGAPGFSKSSVNLTFGSGKSMSSMASFVTLPPSMKQRCATSERLEKLRQNGGNAECERAVSASLEWLKSQQHKDGYWGQAGGKRDRAAMTGLALLCYLGRCETPDSPFYGDNVMDAIMFLVELSKKNPYGAITEDFKSNHGAYEHGIATYALGEMYTLARLGSKQLPGMREAFEKGVKLIIETQNKADAKNAEGSWDYYTKNLAEGKKTSNREDLSVAGWQYQALKAAKYTGLKIDGLSSAINRTCDYIERLQTKDGGYGKPGRDMHYNQWSLTGVGTLGLQTLGKGRTASIKKGIRFLRDFLTEEPLDWEKNCNLYCWYYYTQTFFQAGGEDWKFYNEQFLPQILAAQQPDGSFKKGRPNWPIGDAADPVYRQVLCTLMLEVYYRYLKVGDREEESFFDR